MSKRICHSLAWSSLFLLLACQPGKKLERQAPSKLKMAVEQYIECLNNPSIACLNNVYSVDFEGLAPVVKQTSKDSLITQIYTNYTQNQWQVEGKVVDLEAGPRLGYVLLDWKILQPSDMETVREVFSKRQLQIWHYIPAKGWQLHRSLFYDPTAILF
ncbi:MAG: hypothetical protein AAF990_22450 [Bacteroidota bacterium]